jgi:hypothetical protein
MLKGGTEISGKVTGPDSGAHIGTDSGADFVTDSDTDFGDDYSTEPGRIVGSKDGASLEACGSKDEGEAAKRFDIFH